jgi:uncharacterized cupredoxin-like copper-binding protein
MKGLGLGVTLVLATVGAACGNGNVGTPVTSTEQPQSSARPTQPSITAEELAAADVLLITGETKEDLELGGYGFERNEIDSPGPTIRVDAGKPVTVALKNVHGYIDDEDIDHDFAVVAEKEETSEPLWGSQTDTLNPGQADIVSFTPGEPGRYFYICTLSGHLSAHGMWGRFLVEEVVA